MKKILAVILVTTILLCSSIISVGAVGLDLFYEIRYGETITVEISDSKIFSLAMIQFIPEESGCYALTSSSDNEINDPYCELFDGESAEAIGYNDDYDGYDFCLKYDFEAGKLYYFMVYDYSGAAQLDVTLGCGHNYVDGFCEYCSEECPHTPIVDYLGLCECKKEFAGTDIYAGDTVSYVFDEDNLYSCIFRFVPETDGTYTLVSSDSAEEADPYVDLLDEEMYYIHYADDSEDDLNFSLSYNFEAGKTYYFVVEDYNESAGGFDMTLEKAVHEAQDGSMHDLSFVPEVYSSCTEIGYTEGLYCEECDKFISGHEEIPMDEHWDFDVDGYCDACDAEVPLPDCSHICHSDSPIISFLWKIINVFNKLLGRNFFCECGAYHFA